MERRYAKVYFHCFVCTIKLNSCTACLIVRPSQGKMSNSLLESLMFLTNLDLYTVIELTIRSL